MSKRFNKVQMSTPLPVTDSHYDPWEGEMNAPGWSPEKFSSAEKRQSAGFYSAMDRMLYRHQEEVRSRRKLQQLEIEKIVNIFSLRFEEFQTVFEWKQNLQKNSEMIDQITERF